MPTLGTLAAGLTNVADTARSEVFLTELGDDDQPLIEEGVAQYRRLQYFPESVNDTKAVNYQPKEIPGGSLPLYQYVGSGERTISFTAVFTSDIDHMVGHAMPDIGGPLAELEAARGGVPGAIGSLVATLSATENTRVIRRSQERLRAAGALGRNPYIPGALAWLRRFMLPRYGESSDVGVPLTRPPHKLILHFPGSEIERLGGVDSFSTPNGGILCIMTQCDITFEAFFPSGNPRIATVNLAFAEVPQRAGHVRFPSGRPAGTGEWYWLGASTHSRTGR